MRASLFCEYANEHFSSEVKSIAQGIDTRKYLFKEFFKPKPEPFLRFEHTSRVMELIPKLMIRKELADRHIVDVRFLLYENQDARSILFSDVKGCLEGIYARLEFMALSAISSGVISLDEAMPKIEFDISCDNRFGVSLRWDDPKAKPLDDIEKITETALAKGDTITKMYMRADTFNLFKKNDQVKKRYAAHMNLRDTDGLFINLDKCHELLLGDYGLSLRVINSSVKAEKNGEPLTLNPWEAGKVVFSLSDNFGDLAYGFGPEVYHPSKAANYEMVDNYILLSKFSREDPLSECTAAQAYALPVLNNTDSLYQMNTLNTKWS